VDPRRGGRTGVVIVGEFEGACVVAQGERGFVLVAVVVVVVVVVVAVAVVVVVGVGEVV
jgi:hypothetical protein